MVLDVVVRHWISLAEKQFNGLEGWERKVLCCAILFYKDDGLIDYTDNKWVQGAFNILTGLFDRVGIGTMLVKWSGFSSAPTMRSGPSQKKIYNFR